MVARGAQFVQMNDEIGELRVAAAGHRGYRRTAGERLAADDGDDAGLGVEGGDGPG